MKYQDMDVLNRHIFTAGNIQVSPQQLMALNARPPVPFQSSHTTTMSNAGYRVFLSGYAAHVLQKENSVYSKHGLDLNMSINRLRSLPRPVQGGYTKKSSTDTMMVTTGVHKIWYRIGSGQILVYNIEPIDSIQNARDRLEKPALYRIKRNGQGVWENRGKVSQVSSEYAAVNGQSNNLNKATWLMGAHLDFEFGKSKLSEYTLFHNPSVGGMGDTWESLQDKLGFTTDVTKQFAGILQSAQSGEKDIKWIAHSQGGVIFAEAVRYHLNGNSSWALFGGFNGAFRDRDKIALDKHSVAFHGNANNNFRSRFLFDRAGVKVLATRANDYDGVYNLIGMNTLNPWKWLGSAVYWNHMMSGSVQQSPHTMMHRGFPDWDDKMINGPGKGRNSMQKAFDTVDKAGRSAVKYIQNFVK